MTGNQLKIELKKINITQEVAAEKLGVTRRTLQNWFAMSELDANISQNVKLKLGIGDFAEMLVNYERRGVPYYNVDFIGGFDVVLNDQTANPECYIEFPAYERADMWANITGKSMEPLISHGDMIALRKVEDWDTYMLYGEIYGIVTDEYRTVKKVRTSKKGDDFIRLVPMNEQFDEQDIPKSIVRAVFQIIGCAKKIF